MKKLILFIPAVVVFLNLLAQNVGVGVPIPAQKLDVAGNIKLSGAIMPGGIAGNAGQVLTSAGAGNTPTWENTSYTGGGRLLITPTNNTRSSGSFTGRGGWNLDGAANLTTQTDSLDYGSTSETGTDFTINNPGLVNNYIMVNRTGLYHFEGNIRYFVTSTLSTIMLPRATLFLATSSNMLLFEDLLEKTGGSETANATNTYNLSGKFQLNIHLTAGSTVTFITGFNNLRYPSATNLIAMGVSSGGYITGQFVAE